MAQSTNGSNAKKKTTKVIAAIIAALLLLGAGAYAYKTYFAPKEDAGAKISSFEGMSDEEIQAELNRLAEESRMTISVCSKPELKDGKVRVNVVNEEGSRFDQRFTLEQDGKELYQSGIVKAGKSVEWVEAEGAHAGEATVTVSAVDKETGGAAGGPQAVAVEIVEAQ